MDEIAKQWEKLTLTDLEGEECALREDVVDGSCGVVARFLTKWKVNLRRWHEPSEVRGRQMGILSFVIWVTIERLLFSLMRLI